MRMLRFVKVETARLLVDNRSSGPTQEQIEITCAGGRIDVLTHSRCKGSG